MHVPDGFLDATTSIASGAISVGAVGLSLKKAEAEIREAGPALAGLTAAFVFAAQMINFPVGAGTSGHLMGGALAAVLVGPWTAVICLAVVLLIQALLFADGGLTALGTNVLLISIVTVLVGYFVTRAVMAVAPKKPGSVVGASAVGAFVSVPAAALVFVALYAVGGAVPIPLGAMATAMLGWHLIIGLGEALITGAVVGAVVASRPDLVYAVRHLRRELVVHEADGSVRPVMAGPPEAAAPQRSPLIIGGLVTLIVAGVVSLFASGNPDGLEFVGEHLGFAGAARDSAVAGGIFADYGIAGIDGAWATGVAGVIGVAVTVALSYAVLRLRARRTAPESPTAQPAARSEAQAEPQSVH